MGVTQRKRIGIIGLGDIAQKAYLPILGIHPGVEIVGVMSTTESTVRRIAEQYRIGMATTELADLLRLEPEAVFVHSPTETHASIAIQALEAGIHVYIDKPLSYDISESYTMANTAEKADKLLCVGFNRRFAPFYAEAKAWMEAAGGFDVSIAQKHRVRPQKHDAKRTLYDDLIHMLDLLVWLGGDLPEFIARTLRADDQGKLIHASGVLALGQASGLFTMDRYAGGDIEKLELHGNGRSVEVTNMEHAFFYDQSGPTTGSPAVKTFGSWDSNLKRRGFSAAIEHFLETMDHKEACILRSDLVIPTHELVEKLTK